MSANPNDPRVIERIRRMSGEERVRLGAEWYEATHAIMADGVRDQHPDWNEAQVRVEVRRRCVLTREREEMTWP
ncbi:MAG: hypothetical protein Q7R80_00455 [bacterium]|nr:hypothetical protein [bacterium]